MAQTISPYDWQQPSVDRLVDILSRGPFAWDGSDCGTGKTIVALAAMIELKHRFVVIAPKASHTAWQRTIEAMNCETLCIGICNPEKLLYKNDFVKGKPKSWQLPDNTLVIFDEIHRGASGEKSKLTQLVALLKYQKIPLLALSATIADSPLKLRAIGYHANLHSFKPSSFYPWCLKMGCVRNQHTRSLMFIRQGPKAQRVMHELHLALAPFATRIRVADAPGFPESLVIANLYDIEADYTAQFNEIYAQMDLAIRMPGCNPNVELLRARQRTELLKVPLLIDLALEAIAEGKAPVVFVCFTETRERITRSLIEKGIKTGQIYGQQKDRQENMDSFQANQLDAMICMIQAGGVSVSLHDQHRVKPRATFITPSFSASDLIQTLGRTPRAGGTNVIQTIVLCANTVEERVHRSIKSKLSTISLLNDGDLSFAPATQENQ